MKHERWWRSERWWRTAGWMPVAWALAILIGLGFGGTFYVLAMEAIR
jgi:hypothetical protein